MGNFVSDSGYFYFTLHTGEHYEDHSDYLKSWISVLSGDYNEFFRACADAEKISERLVGNYSKKYELPMPEMKEISDRQEAKISDRTVDDESIRQKGACL